MKYIRTKNTIYDGSRFLREYTGWYFNENSKLYAFTESEIIKTANTIEELCDEFIWKWNGKEFPYSTLRRYTRIGGLGDLMREIRCQLNYGKNLNYDYKVFGAIWTDKGLIYKTKMKGVLPNGKID